MYLYLSQACHLHLITHTCTYTDVEDDGGDLSDETLLSKIMVCMHFTLYSYFLLHEFLHYHLHVYMYMYISIVQMYMCLCIAGIGSTS